MGDMANVKGNGRTDDDAAVRLAYAERIAKPGMPLLELVAQIRERFGHGLDPRKLKPLIEAPLGHGRGPKHTAVRLAFAERIATSTMSTDELRAKVDAEFGQGFDAHDAREILRKMGAPVAKRRSRKGKNSVAGATERRAYAAQMATAEMTNRQLQTIVKAKYGQGVDTAVAHALIRKASGRARRIVKATPRRLLPVAPTDQPTDLVAVNRALERAHPDVETDGALEPGIRVAVENLARQMKRTHMTRLALDLTTGTFDCEWARRVTGRLSTGEK